MARGDPARAPQVQAGAPSPPRLRLQAQCVGLTAGPCQQKHSWKGHGVRGRAPAPRQMCCLAVRWGQRRAGCRGHDLPHVGRCRPHVVPRPEPGCVRPACLCARAGAGRGAAACGAPGHVQGTRPLWEQLRPMHTVSWARPLALGRAPGSAPGARAHAPVSSLVGPLALSQSSGLRLQSRHARQVEVTRP